MKEIDNDERTLRNYIGKPLLMTSKTYVGNTRELSPAWVYLGILEEPRKDSLWLIGPLLRVNGDIQGYKVYNVLGVDYIPNSPHMEQCVPLPGSEMYSFNSDYEGCEIIEKILRLEDVLPII
ncbi:MAG: hypothetical protein Q7S74_04060 [Nanoarchaeota archaeon]|nr:hypothetical protein [Nanoarchaeota archaeon]